MLRLGFCTGQISCVIFLTATMQVNEVTKTTSFRDRDKSGTVIQKDKGGQSIILRPFCYQYSLLFPFWQPYEELGVWLNQRCWLCFVSQRLDWHHWLRETSNISGPCCTNCHRLCVCVCVYVCVFLKTIPVFLCLPVWLNIWWAGQTWLVKFACHQCVGHVLRAILPTVRSRNVDVRSAFLCT